MTAKHTLRVLCVCTLVAASLRAQTPSARVTAPASAPEIVPADDPAIRLPPITVQLQDATPEALAEAFSVATRTPFYVTPSDSIRRTGPTVSLNAVHQPFWEAMDTLNKNYGVFLDDRDGRPETSFTWNFGRLQKAVTWNGFLLYPVDIFRTMGTNPQSEKLPTDELDLRLAIRIDPRIKLLATTGITLSSMTDDLGADLLRGIVPSVTVANNATHAPSVRLNMPFPLRHGQKITSIKGVAHVALPLESKTFALPEPDQHLRQVQTLEGQSFAIDFLKLTDSGLQIRGHLEPSVRSAGAQPRSAPLPIQLDILGADGKHTAYAMTDYTEGAELAVKGPFQISAIIATRTRQVDVPFEFTDLLLPK